MVLTALGFSFDGVGPDRDGLNGARLDGVGLDGVGL